MKKAILLSMISVVTLLISFTGAKAQQGFYVGAQGASQVSVMYNGTDADKPGADYKSKLSHSFGLSGGYNFNSHMGIGTEVMYSNMKQRYIDNTVNYTQKFTYLKIPVLFTYNTNPDKKLIFTAKAGPQVGVLLKSRISGASDQQLNGSTMDQYKKLTWGAMAGAGVRMRVAERMYVDAGIRLDGTISNTEDTGYKNYTAGRSKTRNLNGGLELGVKYFF